MNFKLKISFINILFLSFSILGAMQNSSQKQKIAQTAENNLLNQVTNILGVQTLIAQYADELSLHTQFDKSNNGHTKAVIALDYLGGAFLVSCSHDNTIKLWNMSDLTNIRCSNILNNNDHFNDIPLACSPHEQHFVTASNQNINIRDIHSKICISSINGKDYGLFGQIEFLAYSPDNKFLVVVDSNGPHMFDISDLYNITHVVISYLPHINNIFESIRRISSLIFSQNGKFLVFGHKKHIGGSKVPVITVCDMRKRFPYTLEKTGHSGWINALAYSPDSKFLASGSADSTIKIWSMNNLDNLKYDDIESNIKCLNTFDKNNNGHTARVNTLEYFPDGKNLISGSSDRSIKIWDLNSGTCLQTIDETNGGHTASLFRLVYSPDGRYLASCSADSTIKIWVSRAVQLLKSISNADTKKEQESWCVIS